MKKISLLSSLLCSALAFGCGDDKDPANSGTNTTKTTQTTNDDTDGNSTGGNNSTPEVTTGGPGGDPGGDPGTSGTPDETAGETTMGFIVPMDGGGGTKECDQWVQDCPDAKQKCMPYSGDGDGAWESLKCVDIDPNPKQVGDECMAVGGGVSGVDNCDKGLMCWNTNENDIGVCVAMCKGTPEDPECDPGTECSNSNDGVLTLCLNACDPLLQDCAGTDLCIYNPEDGGETWICVLDASGDEGQVFDPCGYLNDCDKGHLCLNASLSMKCMPDADGCCLPLCSIEEGDKQCTDLDAAMKCLPWYDESQMDPEKANIGVCGIPQG